MALGGKAKAAAEAALKQYEGLTPGVAAVAKETVGGLLVTEGWTGLPTLSRRNTPASIASGAFLFLFGAVWLGITSFALFGAASRQSAPLVFVLIFPAVGVVTFTAGCWQLATGAALVAAGRRLQRDGRAARAGTPPLSVADQNAVTQSATSTYRHLRNPNLVFLEAEIASSPELAQFREGIAHLPPQLQGLLGIDLAPQPAEPAAILQPEVDPYAPGAPGAAPTQWPSMPLSSQLPGPATSAWVAPSVPPPAAPPIPWPIPNAAPPAMPAAPPAAWPSGPAAGPTEWRFLSDVATLGGSGTAAEALPGAGDPSEDASSNT